MSNSIMVMCGQCQHFKKLDEPSDYGDNGECSDWLEQVAKKESILINSRYFNQQLGGCPINDETPRHCNKFAGKYVFVVGA